GYLLGRHSFSRCACSASCSAGSSSPGWSRSMGLGGSPSSDRWSTSPTVAHSCTTLLPPGGSDGWSMPRRPLATGGSARLPVALYPPGCDLEQPPDRLRRDRHHLPLQGLPPRQRGP